MLRILVAANGRAMRFVVKPTPVKHTFEQTIPISVRDKIITIYFKAGYKKIKAGAGNSGQARTKSI